MWERRIRLYSGLLVGLYVILHLINHSLGLISMEAMEAMRAAMALVFREPPGGYVLMTAFLIHFTLALMALYRKATLRMPVWEAAQIWLGILIFPLILVHVSGTALAHAMLDFEPTYEYVISALWVSDPMRGVQQTLVLLVVWGHFCVGIHFWLRLKPWYRRWMMALYGGALVLPVLALLGFARVGRALTAKADSDPLFLSRVFEPIARGDPDMVADLSSVEPNGWLIFALLLASVLVARLIRRAYRNRHGRYQVKIPGGRRLAAPVGQSILETLRNAGIPHASVCGGRGRCTTCRVHVGDAFRYLPPPGEVERAALARIGAEPEVRLACQTRPRRDLAIVPLMPSSATAAQANAPGGIQGREQQVAVMFTDLRGSTKLGEEKLPYDVLFVLNQYFAEMSAALKETNGHYAQFSGDGLMALYGVEGDIEAGCRDAVRGARRMAERLDNLNEHLRQELREPLRMGVGIHCGDAIVGTMGPPTAQNFSAIGDNVNIAARLEALTKEHGCFLIISEEAAAKAGFALDDLSRAEAPVRGRDEMVAVYMIPDPKDLETEPA